MAIRNIYVLGYREPNKPDFFRAEIECEEGAMQRGEHLTMAKQQASAAGFTALFAIDQSDPAAGWLSKQSLAYRFLSELTTQYETIGGIAEQYGAAVLADMIWLTYSLMEDEEGKFIEVFDDKLIQVIEALPSSEDYMRYIHRVE